MENIKYINKDFKDFEFDLEKFLKDYFPNNYKDFTPASTGKIFTHLSSYIGDYLSHITDINLQENYPDLSKDKKNLFRMAYWFGYQPKLTSPSQTIIEISQTIPNKNDGNPNMNYSLVIPKYTKFTSSQGITFYNEEDIYFISPKNRKIEKLPNNSIITKRIKLISGELKNIEHEVRDTIDYYEIWINDSNFINTISVRDQNNKYYFNKNKSYFKYNVGNINDENNNDFNIIKNNYDNFYDIFIKDINKIKIIFGIKDHNFNEGKINNSFLDINNSFNKDINYKSYFYLSNSLLHYGPKQGDIINIEYLSNLGKDSNIPKNSINDIDKTKLYLLNIDNSNPEFNNIINNININQPYPSIGGGYGDTIQDLRSKIKLYFQNPTKQLINNNFILEKILEDNNNFIKISKSYLETNNNNLDLYLLSYDEKGNFTNIYDKELIIDNNKYNNYLKEILFPYINNGYFLNILSPIILNIGIEFSISVREGLNSKKILKESIRKINEELSNEKMEINKPLNINTLYKILLDIKGIKNINYINITNKTKEYSEFLYDIKGAIKNNILYPPKDISIFEIKNPELDIKGKIENI